MTTLRASLLAATFFLAAALPVTAQIRIGIAAPEAGPLAPLGEQIVAGVEAAVARIDADGGLLGQTIAPVFADDDCEASRAQAVADDFVAAGVVLVVGHPCSAAAIAAAEIYADAGIILIATGAPDARFSEGRPGAGIFRLFGRGDEQAAVLADFFAERPESDPMAIVDDASLYGRTLAGAVAAELASRGREPALTISATEPLADIVDALRREGIETVLLAGEATGAAALVIEMAAQDFHPLIVGGDALVDQAFADATGDLADGVLFTYPPDPAAGANALPALAAIAENGGPAEGLALYAYAAIEMWAEAVSRAVSLDYAAVAAVLGIDLFETALGTIGFVENGEVTLPGWTFYQWVEGAYQPVSP